MSTEILLLALVDGLAYAGLLFLVALGLTFIFGVVNVLNIAHGSFYAFGGYLAASLAASLIPGTTTIISALLILVGAAIFMGIVLGSLLMLLLRPFQERDPILQLLVTFGAFMILEDIQLLIWGAQPYYVTLLVDQMGVTEVLGVVFLNYQLWFIPTVAITIFILFRSFLKYSLIGRQIIAVSHHREVAASLGINTQKISLIAFIIGATLGALGGALAAQTTAFVPGVGADMIVLSFAVVATAGLGQISGALLAAILISVARAFSVYLAPQLEVVMPYLIMVAVLLIKPQGLFSSVQARRI